MSTQLAIKTALAAVLAWSIPQLLHWNYSIYAVIASIIVMGLTSGNTFKLSLQRVSGTLIGGLIGSICVLTLGTNPLSLGISVFVGIYLASYLKFKEAAKLSGYVAALIVVTHSQKPWLQGWGRLVETLFGVGVALVVNRYLWRSPADHELQRCITQILATLEQLYAQITECYWTEQNDEQAVNALKSRMVSLMPESRELWKEVKQSTLDGPPEISINPSWEFLIRRVWEHVLMMEHSALVKRKHQDTFWKQLEPELRQLSVVTIEAFQKLRSALQTSTSQPDISELEPVLNTATAKLDQLQQFDHAEYPISELLRFFNFFYTLEEVSRKLLRMADGEAS
jgi:hypothetical protein